MEFDRQLADLLSEFARTLVTDFPIQSILDHLVVRIVDVLPITGAGVTLISPGSMPRYVAASNPSALRFEQLQTELGEGPCIAAYDSGNAVAVPDLRVDQRFPRFAPRAVEDGLMAVFTFPLRQGDHQLGALDMYRDVAGPLDAGAMMAAQTLADVAAAYLLNAQARADLRESSERAHESAMHDALTGLPNRSLLVQRLDHAIVRCQRSDKIVAVLFCDLDQFKAINDTYGHLVGDRVLQAVVRSTRSVLREGDVLVRYGGEEFVIVLPGAGRDDRQAMAERVRRAVADSEISENGQHIAITVSVGGAGMPDQSVRVPEDLIGVADQAMYAAKNAGRDRCVMA